MINGRCVFNVKSQKAIIMFASLQVVCFLLYLVFFDFKQTQTVSVETQTSMAHVSTDKSSQDTNEEPSIQASQDMELAGEKDLKEDTTHDTEAMAEAQLEADGKHETLTIKEEIKEKVKGVLEGTLNLFKKDLKVVSIGDSLTQGIGDETESGGYVGILNHTFEANSLNISIENYGKRGNRSEQLLKRLENKEIASSIKKADVVLITVGANDIMKVFKNNFTNLHLEPFEEERLRYIERLKEIFNKIHVLNPDAKIYLIGFYNPFQKYFSDIEELGMIITGWNETGQSITEEYDYVEYIPIADLFVNPNMELLAEDYFHPNTSAYKLIAKRVLESIEEISVATEETTDAATTEER